MADDCNKKLSPHNDSSELDRSLNHFKRLTDENDLTIADEPDYDALTDSGFNESMEEEETHINASISDSVLDTKEFTDQFLKTIFWIILMLLIFVKWILVTSTTSVSGLLYTYSLCSITSGVTSGRKNGKHGNLSGKTLKQTKKAPTKSLKGESGSDTNNAKIEFLRSSANSVDQFNCLPGSSTAKIKNRDSDPDGIKMRLVYDNGHNIEVSETDLSTRLPPRHDLNDMDDEQGNIPLNLNEITRDDIFVFGPNVEAFYAKQQNHYGKRRFIPKHFSASKHTLDLNVRTNGPSHQSIDDSKSDKEIRKDHVPNDSGFESKFTFDRIDNYEIDSSRNRSADVTSADNETPEFRNNVDGTDDIKAKELVSFKGLLRTTLQDTKLEHTDEVIEKRVVQLDIITTVAGIECKTKTHQTAGNRSAKCVTLDTDYSNSGKQNETQLTLELTSSPPRKPSNHLMLDTTEESSNIPVSSYSVEVFSEARCQSLWPNSCATLNVSNGNDDQDQSSAFPTVAYATVNSFGENPFLAIARATAHAATISTAKAAAGYALLPSNLASDATNRDDVIKAGQVYAIQVSASCLVRNLPDGDTLSNCSSKLCDALTKDVQDVREKSADPTPYGDVFVYEPNDATGLIKPFPQPTYQLSLNGKTHLESEIRAMKEAESKYALAAATTSLLPTASSSSGLYESVVKKSILTPSSLAVTIPGNRNILKPILVNGSVAYHDYQSIHAVFNERSNGQANQTHMSTYRTMKSDMVGMKNSDDIKCSDARLEAGNVATFRNSGTKKIKLCPDVIEHEIPYEDRAGHWLPGPMEEEEEEEEENDNKYLSHLPGGHENIVKTYGTRYKPILYADKRGCFSNVTCNGRILGCNTRPRSPPPAPNITTRDINSDGYMTKVQIKLISSSHGENQATDLKILNSNTSPDPNSTNKVSDVKLIMINTQESKMLTPLGNKSDMVTSLEIEIPETKPSVNYMAQKPKETPLFITKSQHYRQNYSKKVGKSVKSMLAKPKNSDIDFRVNSKKTMVESPGKLLSKIPQAPNKIISQSQSTFPVAAVTPASPAIDITTEIFECLERDDSDRRKAIDIQTVTSKPPLPKSMIPSPVKSLKRRENNVLPNQTAQIKIAEERSLSILMALSNSTADLLNKKKKAPLSKGVGENNFGLNSESIKGVQDVSNDTNRVCRSPSQALINKLKNRFGPPHTELERNTTPSPSNKTLDSRLRHVRDGNSFSKLDKSARFINHPVISKLLTRSLCDIRELDMSTEKRGIPFKPLRGPGNKEFESYDNTTPVPRLAEFEVLLGRAKLKLGTNLRRDNSYYTASGNSCSLVGSRAKSYSLGNFLLPLNSSCTAPHFDHETASVCESREGKNIEKDQEDLHRPASVSKLYVAETNIDNVFNDIASETDSIRFRRTDDLADYSTGLSFNETSNSLSLPPDENASACSIRLSEQIVQATSLLNIPRWLSSLSINNASLNYSIGPSNSPTGDHVSGYEPCSFPFRRVALLGQRSSFSYRPGDYRIVDKKFSFSNGDTPPIAISHFKTSSDIQYNGYLKNQQAPLVVDITRMSHTSTAFHAVAVQAQSKLPHQSQVAISQSTVAPNLKLGPDYTSRNSTLYALSPINVSKYPAADTPNNLLLPNSIIESAMSRVKQSRQGTSLLEVDHLQNKQSRPTLPSAIDYERPPINYINCPNATNDISNKFVPPELNIDHRSVLEDFTDVASCKEQRPDPFTANSQKTVLDPYSGHLNASLDTSQFLSNGHRLPNFKLKTETIVKLQSQNILSDEKGKLVMMPDNNHQHYQPQSKTPLKTAYKSIWNKTKLFRKNMTQPSKLKPLDISEELISYPTYSNQLNGYVASPKVPVSKSFTNDYPNALPDIVKYIEETRTISDLNFCTKSETNNPSLIPDNRNPVSVRQASQIGKSVEKFRNGRTYDHRYENVSANDDQTSLTSSSGCVLDETNDGSNTNISDGNPLQLCNKIVVNTHVNIPVSSQILESNKSAGNQISDKHLSNGFTYDPQYVHLKLSPKRHETAV